MGLRDWLRLFRAHTAPATVYSLALPCIAAGCRSWLLLGYLVGAGTLLHMASFGHNSVMDYLLGVDREDPWKRHHPLPAGRISPERALLAVNLLLYISALLLFAPAAWRPLAVLSLAGFMVAGYAYNTGLDHLTGWGWLAITFAYASLPLYAYYLAACPANLLVAGLIAFWGGSVVYYQIALEGNLKDLWNPADRAPDWLRARCRVEGDRAWCSGLGGFLAWRLASHAAALALGAILTGDPRWLTVLAALYVPVAVATEELHRRMTSGAPRTEMLRAMGLQEVLAFYYLEAALLPLWPEAVALMMLYGYAWFAAMNRLLWGSDRPLV